VISAYLLIVKYGSMTLTPGENYIVNIPFNSIHEEVKYQIVCGTAEKENGNPVEDVKVKINSSSDKNLGENTTNAEGKYCITLPDITSKNKKYDVYVEQEDETLEIGSNDYELDFDEDLSYSKSIDNYAILKGKIINEDARIENGRIEVKVGHKVGTSWKYLFGDYQKYYVNIEPGDTYEIPNEDVNILWEIPSDAEAGEYKFLVKTSFNAEEKNSITVLFSLTN
jgi:hypothetical protein